jgi:hypothetical protein
VLDIYVSLLDHDLRGDIYESVIVGFLKVLGIDSGEGIFKEAYYYTPSLFVFFKIAQMLVPTGSCYWGQRPYEATARFMVNGTRSPLSWASRLRLYGKKVRDSTTCLGYISWSDDNLSVSYRGVINLPLNAFRGFIRDQVHEAHT